MSTIDVSAIDVHAHYGTVHHQAGDATLKDRLMTGDAQTVVRRARMANTRLTIVSPLLGLMPRFGADSVAGNIEAVRVVAETEGLGQWVIVDPLKPQTYDQAVEMLAAPGCFGIKVHPEEHGYPIVEHGGAIFEFAAEHKAILQTHSGEQNSLPEDFVTFANEFPRVKLIVSHLGCGWDDDPAHQVRAIQASKHGNVFTDTSSAVGITSGLLEWAVAEIGADRILYGTDTPLYFAPMQRVRVDNAEISDEDKRMILCENAEWLFNL
ncbi:MAG: amidohydrolase family protein [Phycisphaerae bacterium]|jgi:predicted TIM-barrel fold metal-dependent hydrolase|nr:amidohydrolase family protein [Phycisphaerae bacterium]MDP7636723.1 amidohydrolase family protein [Phycisphaerae bacterium]